MSWLGCGALLVRALQGSLFPCSVVPTVSVPPCWALLCQLPHDHHHTVAQERRGGARLQRLRALHEAPRGKSWLWEGAHGPRLGVGFFTQLCALLEPLFLLSFWVQFPSRLCCVYICKGVYMLGISHLLIRSPLQISLKT